MVTSVGTASLGTFTCYTYNVHNVALLRYDAAAYVFSHTLKAQTKISDNISQVLEEASGVQEVSISSVVRVLQQSSHDFGRISNGAGEWTEISVNKGERLTEETLYKI